jgi:quercetin dioxygenase-like cupin family protein
MVAVPAGDTRLQHEYPTAAVAESLTIRAFASREGGIVATENRRTFLGLAVASLLPVDLGAAQAAAPRQATELARHALNGPLEGFEVVLVQLNNPPGQRGSGPGHRHPGPVLGYVQEGEMLFAINHEAEQVVRTGGTFFEPTGALHTGIGSARPDAAARALVFMVVPKGSPLTTPA